jgi:CelD/BcsL family acetyltransferase involved in cellulose biosynthesis
MPTTIRTLDGVEQILRHRADLDALAEEAGRYFATTAWLEAWAATVGPTSVEGHLATSSTGEVLGWLSTAQLSRPLHRRLRLPIPYLGYGGSGYGAADHLGPVGDPSAVGDLLRAAFGRQRGAVMLESSDAAHVSALREIGLTAVSRTTCPALDLRGVQSESDLWPKHLRKELRRRSRRMAEEGINGEWIEDAERVLDELRALRRVHEARWQAEGGQGLFGDDRQQLLERLCRAADERHRPWLYALRSGGRTVASLLLLRCGRTISSYKSGWEPGLQRLAPGIAMHSAASTRALADGMDT